MTSPLEPVSPEDEQVIRALRFFYNFLVSLPWLWLLMLTLFVLTTAVQNNAWPSYGQPDPKTMPLLYWPTFLLFLATITSLPIWLMLIVFALRPHFPINIQRKDLIIYLGGLALALFIIIGDLGGLMTWLID